jgi:hypothetical protein
MNCPNCNANVPEDARFCNACGVPLVPMQPPPRAFGYAPPVHPPRPIGSDIGAFVRKYGWLILSLVCFGYTLVAGLPGLAGMILLPAYNVFAGAASTPIFGHYYGSNSDFAEAVQILNSILGGSAPYLAQAITIVIAAVCFLNFIVPLVLGFVFLHTYNKKRKRSV